MHPCNYDQAGRSIGTHHALSAEREWSAYWLVHTDAWNRMSEDLAKKLVKVYFNCRALDKVRKAKWDSE